MAVFDCEVFILRWFIRPAFPSEDMAIGVISMIGLSPDIFMPLLEEFSWTRTRAEGYRYFSICQRHVCWECRYRTLRRATRARCRSRMH